VGVIYVARFAGSTHFIHRDPTAGAVGYGYIVRCADWYRDYAQRDRVVICRPLRGQQKNYFAAMPFANKSFFDPLATARVCILKPPRNKKRAAEK
jgi:hypothetical protein